MIAPARATLGSVLLGAGLPVAVMGVLNVSPESFHAGSVHRERDDLVRAALAMVEAGALIVDVGARSTAPYRATAIDERTEEDRLVRAIEALADKVDVSISADTTRPRVARAALDAGATIINDQSGAADPALVGLVARTGVGFIVMAAPEATPEETDPVAAVRERLAGALERARRAGITEDRIVLDPGIGFFRQGAQPWHAWDVAVLAGLARLAPLGRPLAVGVSRKSFLGAITGRASTDDRLAGSLAATAAAVLHGASLVRTHDVAETVDAVRVAERIRDAGTP
jgi:dihydropteroate synthase